jgi:hypothetical protein
MEGGTWLGLVKVKLPGVTIGCCKTPILVSMEFKWRPKKADVGPSGGGVGEAESWIVPKPICQKMTRVSLSIEKRSDFGAVLDSWRDSGANPLSLTVKRH